ncbi:MAG: fimbrial protein [Providencia rettgeri]|uniref:fimbrial protein n=1 Tax=unclassified Providencia TaxID=2633465 RepID=UPI002348FFFC|nr:fimbrial protein [Providencia sp. PROV164]
MNKNIKYTTHCLTALVCFFSAQSIGYDAVFNISGRVSSNTCSIQSSRTQDIDLGVHVIGSSGFGSGVNTKSKAVRWQLDFDCNEGTVIYLYLRGNNYSGSETTLRLASSSDSAKGVGIRTSYSNDYTSWNLMRLGGKTSVSPSYVNGKTIIYFESSYIQMDKAITPGTANASMDIDVTYQ